MCYDGSSVVTLVIKKEMYYIFAVYGAKAMRYLGSSVVALGFFVLLGELSAQPGIRISAQAELFSESANSGLDESSPVLEASSGRLYFTRLHHPQNMGGLNDKGDIWYVNPEQRQKSVATHLGSPLNSALFEHLIGFAANGQLMYLFQEQASSGAHSQIVVGVSSYEKGSWSKPDLIDIPYFRNTSDHQSGYVSPQGDLLLLAVESFGSHGNEDLYVSFKDQQGNWSPLKGLGSDLNTPYQERSPFLLPDRRTLVYATNGRKGHGSWDIYKTTRLDNSWTHWSSPENLGTEINSAGSEMFFSLSPSSEKEGSEPITAYFVSTRSSEGYANLWQVDVGWNPDTTLLLEEVSPSVVADGSVVAPSLLHMRAIDQSTDQLIEEGLRLIIRDPQQQIDTVLLLNQEGSVQLSLVPDSFHSLDMVMKGFLPLRHGLVSPTAGTVYLELAFEPIKRGARFLGDVYFVQGKAEFLEYSQDHLQNVVNVLRENPEISIFIAGHTDNQGSSDENLSLSKARVEAIIDHLASKGVDSARLSGKGYGATQPSASNRNEKKRAKNRRVEFIIQ